MILDILDDRLDFSYESLDVVSSQAESYGSDKVQAYLYDNLVAYIGEVIRRKVKGNWDVRQDYPGCAYPIISAKNNVVMPINVVWRVLYELEPMDLRKETTNEIRRFLLKCQHR
ncbi:MAG: hypothetical protein MUE44_21910 [Oscillatoriaceae cyanobacterium Prado104]|jgi:hypothetical protein|nr:hypothetical protein [Oscillatoriaceae cyanobacterium Prado104]